MIMIFRAEVDKVAHLALHKTSVAIEKALAAAILNSQLQELELEVCYIPIVMDESGRKKYKARSRLDRRSRIYYCCPQLAIEPFLTGTPRERFAEYLGGLRECGPALAKLGATDEQVNRFNLMLAETLEILAPEQNAL